MPGDAPGVALWRVPLDVDEPRVRAALARLDAAERERAKRFRRPVDGRRWTVARATLREVLGRHLDRDPAAVTLRALPGEKPVLADSSSELHFSLAHSGGLALIAVSDALPVGVDCEQVRDLPRLEALVERCFSTREREAWRHLPPDARTPAFFRAWTRKEALLKATGEGLAVPLEAVEVSLDVSAAPLVLAYPRHPEAPRGWSLRHLEPADGYVGALAAPGPLPPDCAPVDLDTEIAVS